MTEKTSVTAPKADTPTWARPPDALATPLVISSVCACKVSSESLPPLIRPPRSLFRASSTSRGRLSLKPRTASTIDCSTTSKAPPTRITVASTSTVEHTARFQVSRRSIAPTTGERTATLKTETRISSRTSPIEASAQARATATLTSRIVRIGKKTSTSRRLVSPATEADSDPVISPFIRLGDLVRHLPSALIAVRRNLG